MKLSYKVKKRQADKRATPKPQKSSTTLKLSVENFSEFSIFSFKLSNLFDNSFSGYLYLSLRCGLSNKIFKYFDANYRNGGKKKGKCYGINKVVFVLGQIARLGV